MNIVRKPDIHRGPQLARSAKATDGRDPGAAPLGRSSPRSTMRLLAGGRVDLARQPDRHDGADHEQQERPAQRPLRAEEGGEPAGDRRGHGRADDAGEADPAVGLDQGQVGRPQPGYGGGAGDAVRLGGDQDPERRGVEQVGLVGDRVGQHPAQEGADGEGRADRPAPAVAEAVEERADQRRDDRERQHGQAQEERDLAAGLAGGAGEEDGGRQRDGDGGVARGVGGVQLDQPRQAGLLGTLRLGRPLGLPHGVRSSNRPVTRADPRRPRPVTFAPVPRPRPSARARSAPVVVDEPPAPPSGPGARPRRAGAGVVRAHAHILPVRTYSERRHPARTDRRTGHESCCRRDHVRCHPRRDRLRRRHRRGGQGSPHRAARGGRRRRRRRPPRPPGRGRARGHPLLRLRAQGLRRLALGRHRHPRLPAPQHHDRRGRAAARRRRDRRAASGCPTASGSSPATCLRATCCPWPTTTRGWCRRTSSATTRSTPTTRRRSAPWPRTSAWAGCAPSRSRAATSPPSAGTTATPAPTPPSRSRLPSPARPAASWSGSPGRCRRPSASAPTATPTTTAGWSPSPTAAGRTPRCG